MLGQHMELSGDVIDLLERADFHGDSIVTRLPGAGSDRDFFRVTDGPRTAILMAGTGHGAGLDNWLEIQRYLRSLGFGVPEVYDNNLDIPAILVEDFGEVPSPKLNEYPLIIKELARLAIIGGHNIESCPTVANRPFDLEAFRRESHYFSERYLRGYRRISLERINRLSPEFDAIAEELAVLPKAFCHRDFQSSNMTIIGGRVRIIDFQSAKFGPPEYDLASLLWDSRVIVQENKIDDLVGEYLTAALELDYPVNPIKFRKNLLLAALSRLMQSLGAYCFLSMIKGKRDFERLIPQTEKNMRTLIRKTGRLGDLLELLPVE